jgi:hypothetical protein
MHKVRLHEEGLYTIGEKEGGKTNPTVFKLPNKNSFNHF